MSSLRDQLRSLTVGATARKARTKLVVLRDATKPATIVEVVYGDDGHAVQEQATDAHGELMFDASGAPVKREKTRRVRPALLLADGTTAVVEVREPSVKLRSAILRAAGLDPTDPTKFDQARYQAEAVIALTYEPGTNVQVFSEADRPALLQQLAGGFSDDIFQAATELMAMNVDEKELAKN